MHYPPNNTYELITGREEVMQCKRTGWITLRVHL